MKSAERPLLLFLMLSLLILSRAEARKAKPRPQEDPQKPLSIEVDERDPEELKELLREHRGKNVRVVTRRYDLYGPAPLRAPGTRESSIAGDGYRPKDVQINDPSFDGFPANFHAEPSIAAQGSAVLCAFNDSGGDLTSPNPATTFRNSDGFAISQDGAETFRDQGKRPLATASNLTSYDGDNVVAAGPDGDFYYLSDGGKGNMSWTAMVVSRSIDGGVTWGPESSPSAGVSSRFYTPFFDKGWIAVDRSSGPTRGNVYVVWSDFGIFEEETDLYVARSTVMRDPREAPLAEPSPCVCATTAPKTRRDSRPRSRSGTISLPCPRRPALPSPTFRRVGL